MTKPKAVRINANYLFARVVNSEEFVILVGNQYRTPEYGSFKLKRGSTVIFIGKQAGAVEIGVITGNTSLHKDAIGVRILERFGTINPKTRWQTVHTNDIFCMLKPYKKKDKLWRLWMEYPGVDKTESCTIRVDTDLRLLTDTRVKLREECLYPDKYKYYLAEVKSV